MYQLCLINSDGEEGLAALADGIRPFVIDGTIDAGLAITKATDTRALIALRDALSSGEGPSRQEIAQLMKAPRNSKWSLRWPLYGPSEIVEAQWARIQRAFAGVPGVEFAAATFRGDEVHSKAGNHAEKCSAGIANDDLLVLLDLWEGVGGHLDFSPVAPLLGSHARALTRLLRPEIERAGLDFWPGVILTPRSFYFVCPLLFDTTNEAQVRAAYDVYRRLVTITGEAGYGLYRGHIAFMDEIAAQYGFNDHALLRLQETLKGALDPDGILSPGKQGIWPRSRP